MSYGSDDVVIDFILYQRHLKPKLDEEGKLHPIILPLKFAFFFPPPSLFFPSCFKMFFVNVLFLNFHFVIWNENVIE